MRRHHCTRITCVQTKKMDGEYSKHRNERNGLFFFFVSPGFLSGSLIHPPPPFVRNHQRAFFGGIMFPLENSDTTHHHGNSRRCGWHACRGEETPPPSKTCKWWHQEGRLIPHQHTPREVSSRGPEVVVVGVHPGGVRHQGHLEALRRRSTEHTVCSSLSGRASLGALLLSNATKKHCDLLRMWQDFSAILDAPEDVWVNETANADLETEICWKLTGNIGCQVPVYVLFLLGWDPPAATFYVAWSLLPVYQLPGWDFLIRKLQTSF